MEEPTPPRAAELFHISASVGLHDFDRIDSISLHQDADSDHTWANIADGPTTVTLHTHAGPGAIADALRRLADSVEVQAAAAEAVSA